MRRRVALLALLTSVICVPSIRTEPDPTPATSDHGPWRRIDAQSNEGDIRLPEPESLLSLASGIALLAALVQRRSR